jgi:hypothetical protein
VSSSRGRHRRVRRTHGSGVGWWPDRWPAGIIVNPLTIPDYYDIALRDFGLLLAAVALARLAQHYHGNRRASCSPVQNP